jgi:surface polysaccharide O-acyltransferase-like enzyme
LIIYEGGVNEIRSIVGSLLQGNVNYHLYFLYYLIGLYTTAPIYRIFTKYASQIEWLYFFILWFVVMSLPRIFIFLAYLSVPYISHLQSLFVKSNFNFWINFSGYFLFGYYIKKFNMSRVATKCIYGAGLIGALITIIGTAIISTNAGKLIESFYEYGNPNIIFMSAALFVFIKNINEKITWNKKQIKIILSLASCVFGVYLIHDVFLLIFFRPPYQILTDWDINTPLYILLVSVFVTVSSFCIILGWKFLKTVYLNRRKHQNVQR